MTRVTPEMADRMVELYQAGYGLWDVAVAVGATDAGIVHRHLKKRGVPRRTRGRPAGESVTPRVREIVAAYHELGTLAKAAAHLCLCPQYVAESVAKYERLTGEAAPRAKRGRKPAQ